MKNMNNMNNMNNMKKNTQKTHKKKHSNMKTWKHEQITWKHENMQQQPPSAAGLSLIRAAV